MSLTSFPLNYYIANDHYGTSYVKEEFEPTSHAFFCPTCGDVWARIVAGGGRHWDSWTHYCALHPPVTASGCGVKGALFRDYAFHRNVLSRANIALALELLPRELLIHDFLLYFDDIFPPLPPSPSVHAADANAASPVG